MVGRLLQVFFSSNKKQAEAKRNKDNQESKKRGRATYTGGSRSMVRAKERMRAWIEESGGGSSALKEYLGTHTTLIDPAADIYSCTYPDTQTQEYCAQVIERTKSLGVDREPKSTAMTTVLDDVHGGHHGGYERFGSRCHQIRQTS
ncbi:uncharacterized protein LOC109824327 [Asparagus officinalis]|uniref:uncharacterized protein LOC109824327 n=1 Tax=Asparagus officinalis TaxID=4686 RepID=UPI00098E58E4|nr:uncharacterized protein LOC109824327 [Asparagus officinalis]